MIAFDTAASRRADLQADRQAKAWRRAVAIQLCRGGWEVKERFVVEGHFEHELERIGGALNAAFNVEVTERTLQEHVLNLDDPVELLRVGSKVTEQHFYTVYRPDQPEKPIVNLAISKHGGTFFTPLDVGQFVTEKVREFGSHATLIDPCAGSGALLGAALLNEADNYSHLVGVELDPCLVRWCEMLLRRAAALVGYQGQLNVICGDGLAYLHELGTGPSKLRADIVINPPYGRVRVTSDSMTNRETGFEDGQDSSAHLAIARSRATAVRAHLRNKYPQFVQAHGVLEWSKLFMSACAQLAEQGATCGVIAPDSWMSGKDALVLRRSLVSQRLIQQIHLIPEDAKRFSTVNQAISLTIIGANERPGFLLSDSLQRVEMDFQRVARGQDAAIPRFTGPLDPLAVRLENGVCFRHLDWLTNARGEVDQTLQRSMFREARTGLKLVRGEHIEQFRVTHTSSPLKPSFLEETEFASFIQSKPKFAHFRSERLIGRQCSYSKQLRRLMFARIQPETAVGNSCNYLVVTGTESESKFRSSLVLGILNSAVLDWYFRTRNSNNHVANYEIDQLPFPVDDRWHGLIAWATAQLEAEGSRYQTWWLRSMLEAAVALAYGISDADTRLIFASIGDVDRRAVHIAEQLRSNFQVAIPGVGEAFFNHGAPTLSELDSLIISHVPEGGNWQQIPEHVPSQRLKQIREMTAERGVVRTTYYGRLRRDQPSYTINTYFNRPGNGTHIHPSLDRTLTAREAARLQSFPDQYIFIGGEGAVRKQIGNAVPPVLAHAIGRKLLRETNSHLCVDAFCGAGGLSLGLERAGWDIVAAVDNDVSALRTYTFNRPDESAIAMKHDLTDKTQLGLVCETIEARLAGRPLGLLAGGPPCQGFSHAGFRSPLDRRNDLAAAYLKMAEILKPEIFLLENVEGLLTYKGGQVLQELCQTLRELGYLVADPTWKLLSEEYGVPQMRRRVFIVGALTSSVDLTPPLPAHQRCYGRWTNRNTLSATLPPPLTVADALAGLSLPDPGPSTFKVAAE